MLRRGGQNDYLYDRLLNMGSKHRRGDACIQLQGDRRRFPICLRSSAKRARRERVVFSGLLVLLTGGAFADGAVKLGTYRLAHSEQVVNGSPVSFYGLPSQTVGLSIDLNKHNRGRPATPVMSFEVFNVEYSLASISSRPSRGRLDTSALLLNARWSGSEFWRLNPYLGFGAGLSAVDFDMSNESENFYQNAISVAGQVFAGIESRFGLNRRFGLLGEVRYFDTAVATVSSRGSGAFIGLSMRLD